MAHLNLDCVLLLEDEPLIAIDLEEKLKGFGVKAVVSLMTCAEADNWLSEHSPDLAIIDPHLKDDLSASAIRILVDRDIPFIVYSGDGSSAIEQDAIFEKGVWLSKPCLPEALFETIAASYRGDGATGNR